MKYNSFIYFFIENQGKELLFNFFIELQEKTANYLFIYFFIEQQV